MAQNRFKMRIAAAGHYTAVATTLEKQHAISCLETFLHKTDICPQEFTLQIPLSSTHVRQLVRASRDNN